MNCCLLSRKEKRSGTISQQLTKKYCKSVKLYFLLLFVFFFRVCLFVMWFNGSAVNLLSCLCFALFVYCLFVGLIVSYDIFLEHGNKVVTRLTSLLLKYLAVARSDGLSYKQVVREYSPLSCLPVDWSVSRAAGSRREAVVFAGYQTRSRRIRNYDLRLLWRR